jgi:glycosyltransferase involved in cell wall biosynthesis
MNVQSDNIPLLIEKLSLQENAILIPQQPRKLIPNYLSACDILCSPKIDCEINRAANPVKVIEYLAMGLPVACSAIGGILDAVKDKFNGLLVKPGDTKDLEEKLEWIILNPKHAKEMGRNGRKSVIANYSSEAIEAKIKHALIRIRDSTKDAL